MAYIAKKENILLSAVGFATPQIDYSKRMMIISMEFDNLRRPNVKKSPL